MVGAQAQQFNGMDQRYNSYQPEYGMNSYDHKQSYGKDSNSYDKSKDNIVTVKKIKCNNINVNLNGDIDIGASEELSALATEAQAEDKGEVGASTLGNSGGSDGSGRPSGSDSDSRFVCIDNNDNTFVEAEEPISELCEECFSANSALQTAILDSLVEFEGSFSFNFVDPPNTGFLIIGPGTDTIEQLCDMIETSSEFYGVPVADVVLEKFIIDFLEFVGEIDPTTLESEIDALIECLLEAGIIVEGEPLPISISDNPITTQSNNPISATTTTQSSNIVVPQSSNIGASQSSNVLPQSNNAIPTQSNNAITTAETTNQPSSNAVGAPPSSNIGATAALQSSSVGTPNTFSSSTPSSPLVNILPSNPN